MKILKDQKAMRPNENKLGKVMDVYENRLRESRYLAGDEFSLANLSHFPNTDYLATVARKEEMFSSRKNVGRWLDESMERESWKKVKELRQILHSFEMEFRQLLGNQRLLQ
ncbi:Glutathione S-transferase [Linum perenne]